MGAIALVAPTLTETLLLTVIHIIFTITEVIDQDEVDQVTTRRPPRPTRPQRPSFFPPKLVKDNEDNSQLKQDTGSGKANEGLGNIKVRNFSDFVSKK